MPVVPISSGASTQQRSRPALPPLDPTFALIAAAQMHSEGRLIALTQPPEPDAKPVSR